MGCGCKNKQNQENQSQVQTQQQIQEQQKVQQQNIKDTVKKTIEKYYNAQKVK